MKEKRRQKMKEKTAITYFIILGKKKKQIRKKQEFGMVMPSLASFSQ